MTTPQPAALPELQDFGPWHVSHDGKYIDSDNFNHDVKLVVQGDFRNDEQRRSYSLDIAKRLSRPALAALQSQPAAETALQKFVRLNVADEVRSPLEQLRSFCSFAMSGQDWIDCEPFFDAIVESAQPAAAGVSDLLNRIDMALIGSCKCMTKTPDVQFHKSECPYRVLSEARAILALRPQSEPDELSPDFTDTARAALLWVLWHHQGGSSPVGQPIRYALGMGAHESLNAWQVSEAKRWAAITGSQTSEFHNMRRPQAVPMPCTWEQEDECGSAYSTTCGNTFMFEDGGPSDNGAKFCCYCGGRLSEQKWVEPADDDGITAQGAQGGEAK